MHLGQAPPSAPSPLPWILMGGAVLLGVLWFSGVFDGVDDSDPEPSPGDTRPPRASRTGNALVGRVVDKLAGKLIDRALNKVF